MHRKICKYVDAWLGRGYAGGIPDEVPHELMVLQLAPSYKAICMAILRNDHPMKSLGFSADKSPWYSELKRIEIAARPGSKTRQEDMFR